MPNISSLRKRNDEGEAIFTNKRLKSTGDFACQLWETRLSEGSRLRIVENEDNSSVTVPQEVRLSECGRSESAARVDEALAAAAGKPFSKENLKRKKRWL